jgi:hypothetical protein
MSERDAEEEKNHHEEVCSQKKLLNNKEIIQPTKKQYGIGEERETVKHH